MFRHFPIFVLALILPLLGCKDVSAPVTPVKPSFSQMEPLHFRVSSIDIIEDYVPPMKSPNVEHLFPTPPSEGVKIWVNDRLRADGGNSRLEVNIKEASVKEVQLPRTPGIKGTFTVDQAQRYEARLIVEVKVYDGTKLLPDANVDVNVSKSKTIAEDATLEERERLFNEITNELLAMMNTELERNIRSYLSQYMN